MRIGLAQYDIAWENKTANFQKAIDLLKQMERKTDLVVFPEMFSTGFSMNSHLLAETMDGETMHLLQQWSQQFNMALAGSFICKENEAFFNRAFFITPEGDTYYYDKRHLFGIGGEDEHYTAGHDRTVVEWGGFRILLLVCYDLRFPVFARNRGDYDMILCVANWPQSRRRVWDTLLRARAIENVCYVAGVNRVGSDPVCAYNGGTAFIDYRGESVGTVDDGSEGVLRVSADLDGLAAFRRKYPMLDDADAFELRFE